MATHVAALSDALHHVARAMNALRLGQHTEWPYAYYSGRLGEGRDRLEKAKADLDGALEDARAEVGRVERGEAR